MDTASSSCEIGVVLEKFIGRSILKDAGNQSQLTKIQRVVSDKRADGCRVSLEIVMEVDISASGSSVEKVSARVCPVYHSGPSRWNSQTLDDQNSVIIRCGDLIVKESKVESTTPQPILGLNPDSVTLEK